MIKKVTKYFKDLIIKYSKIYYKSAYYTIMHDGIENAGYLAFLALLSLFPFLVFLIAIAASMGREEYGARFIADFLVLMPENIVETIKPAINDLLNGPPQGILTIAVLGLLWTASSIVEAVRNVLNRAYRVTNPPRYIFRRMMSIVQIIIITFLVIFAMFFITVAPGIFEIIQTKLHIPLEYNPNLGTIRLAVSSIIIFFSISFSYYALPNIKQSFWRTFPGTILVFLLWIGVGYVFSTYIAYYQRINIIYGSLASIILTLLFFYILSLFYILGAEFNYFFERASGNKIVQKE